MSSMIVALRPCSCRRGKWNILAVRLWLQAIAKDIVRRGRVVEVRFQSAQLGDGR
jgi:hypothetical protein